MTTGTGRDAIELRSATTADVKALVDICRSSFPDSLRWQGPSWIAARHWRYWLSWSCCRCWVCCHGEEVLGFVVLVLDCARYRAQAQAGRVRWFDSALMLLWHPVLAMNKAVHRLLPRSTGVKEDIPHDPRTCTWIELIAVRPDRRRTGLGAMMLEHCIKTAGMLGYGRIKLRVSAGNTHAVKAYERIGFAITAKDKNTYTYTYSLK